MSETNSDFAGADHQTVSLPAARFCTECGAAAHGKFCASCGTAVDDARSVAAPDAPPSKTSVHPTAPLVGEVPSQPRSRRPAHDARGDLSGDAASADGQGFAPDLLDFPEAGDEREEVSRRPVWLTRQPSRRTAALAATAVAAVAILTAGGVVLVGYLGNGAEREALKVSRSQMSTAIGALSTARDADAVAAAAGTADNAADRIDTALRGLGQADDPASKAVHAQLAAEVTLLSSLGELSALPDAPLEVWGQAHSPITDAVEAEGDTRAALAAQDADAVDGLPDTGAMLTALTGTVGAALAADAVTEGGTLLTGLQEASTTSALRAVAAKAAEQQPAVESVLDSLTEDSGKPALVAYERALRAVAGLAELDGERAGAWAGARSELTAAFGALAGAAGDSGAGLTAQATGAVDATDKMISAAAAAIADWQAATAAAIKDRDSDSAALTGYADNFRAELKSYELLRKDLQSFFDRVQDPNVFVTYYEAYDELFEAEESRKDVRDRIAGLAVPGDVRAEHDAVIAMISRSVNAVRAAYDGSAQADACEEYCYYRDTPGFATFQSESASISKSYGEVTGAWESAVEAAKAATAQRALPPKPEV